MSSLSDDQMARLDAMGRKAVSTEGAIDMQRAKAAPASEQYRELTRFSSQSSTSQTVANVAPTVQMVERPTYDAMGNVTGTEYVPADNTPTMGYADQMRNALAATGQLAIGGLKGVVNGVPELIVTAGKGWAYLGALAGEASGILSNGTTDRTIAALDSKIGRVFEYDNGLQFMGGIAGGLVSPGAYAKGTELGLAGVRALGPTVDAMMYGYMQRTGGVLNAVPDGPRANIVVPYGFSSSETFTQFGESIRSGLARAGFTDVEPILQGSAVTGKSFRTGQPFDSGRVSDFDVGLASENLLNRAQELGINLRSGGTRTGPLTARDLRALGLRDLSNQLSQQAGRDVNFMIYNSSASALERAPSVIVPNLRK